MFRTIKMNRQLSLGLFVLSFLLLMYTIYRLSILYLHDVKHSLTSTRDENVKSSLVIPEDNLMKSLIKMTFGVAKPKIVIETHQVLLYDVQQPIPKEADEIECISMDKAVTPYYVCPHPDKLDSYLSPTIKRYRIWEAESQNVIKKFIDYNHDVTFIDLGCNIGLHALFAAVLGSKVRVLALDPWPKNLIRIHKAAHLNKVQNKVDLVLAAISHKRGPVTFSDMAETVAGTLMIESSQGFHTTSIVLNDLTSLVKTKSAILKIDVERMECYIFSNAEQFFEQINIKMILMEYRHTKEEGACCVENMLKFLADRKFKAFDVNDFNHASPLNMSLWSKWTQHDVLFINGY